jgi:hypothetical protein
LRNLISRLLKMPDQQFSQRGIVFNDQQPGFHQIILPR